MSETLAFDLWENLTIQSNFIFSKTMELKPELCRQLPEFILRIKIKSISYPDREKVIEERTDSKSIRLDVYVEEKDTNRSFDVEMQISNSDNLAKRLRYYQGLIDLDKLKHGQHYSALGESYIIFICTFDKFRAGRHIYTFCEFCVENPKISLNDGATKIFLNTKGKLNDVSEEMHNFLNYVESGIIKSAFVKAIDDAVQEVKSNKRARLEYMTYQMEMLEREMKGRAEGDIKRGLTDIRNLMETLQLTAKQAMDALKIPKDEQSKYAALI